MWHHHQVPPIRRAEPGDPAGRTIGVEGIPFRHLAVVIHVAQRRQPLVVDAIQDADVREQGAPFAVRHPNAQSRPLHTS